MAQLSDEHIAYIEKDLFTRGVVYDGLHEELVDHICAAVEEKIASGMRFYEAYEEVIHAFGDTNGLWTVQHNVIQSKPNRMLKSYLRIAFRNHMKNKFHTIINIVGLAIGISTCMIITRFVLHELSYDRFHENADRIYRVDTEIRLGNVHHNLALGSSALAGHFRAIYPEIESAVRIWDWGYRTVSLPDQSATFSENVMWGDSTFFEVFTVPLLEGNAASVLDEANTVAISQTMADKFFPGERAMGKTIVIDGTDYRVTGIFKNLPANSHIRFDMLRSIVGLEDAKIGSLIGGAQLSLYLLLRPDADPRQLEAKFPDFVNEHVAPQLSAIMPENFTMDTFLSEGNTWTYTLTPLADIHLYSNKDAELDANGSITYVYLFSAIAAFILFIACINFMNLSTARSSDRAKEVGIRKVMGSLRSHLVRQFLVESLVLSLTAFLLAVGLAQLFLPVFNALSLKEISLPFDDWRLYVALVIGALVVGVLAGLYPSLYLSRFSMIGVLKGSPSVSSNTFVRNGLVVFQFVISIFLIIATISIRRQLTYAQNMRIGFDRDQVVVVHDTDQLGNQVDAFKDAVLRNSFIVSGTTSGFLPVENGARNKNTFWPEGRVPTGEDVNYMVSMQMWSVDPYYLETLGISLKSGRNFSPERPSDSGQSLILNEAAVQKFGFGDDAIGKKVSMFTGTHADGTPDLNSIKTMQVIGVIHNFHFESVRRNIEPLALAIDKSTSGVAFRFSGTDPHKVLSTIETTWNKMAPDQPFRYSFLDEDLARMYREEKRLGTIFAIFAGLAILIACLGLFALVSYTAERRTKEIGIRKTLGATVGSIVLMLCVGYGRLIVVAFVLAAPIARYAVNWWLSGYAYRTTIGIPVYLITGVVAFVIAMITISYQSLRAARANPARSLRSE